VALPIAASLLLIRALRNLVPKPHVIALAWPERTRHFEGKADCVIQKPLMMGPLVAAIDGLEAAAASAHQMHA
jgi:hypothetical protein